MQPSPPALPLLNTYWVQSLQRGWTPHLLSPCLYKSAQKHRKSPKSQGILKPTVAELRIQTNSSYAPWNSQKHFSKCTWMITQEVNPDSLQGKDVVS